MSFFKWSKTANNNATADATINWAEGQAPSTVNDSARAMMAAAAKYRDDVAGALTTGGTSTAYTLATNQAFDSLANMDRKVVAFIPHTTNGAGAVTLNVDGLGARQLRSHLLASDIPAGTLIAGTAYAAVYDNANNIWLLYGAGGGGSLGIPLAGGIPYFGTVPPNSAFAFPFGQALSRTVYAPLFGLLGTTYGPGDGSTTFNLPDLRGRSLFGKDDMGGSAANRITAGGSGISGNQLGAAGGAETHALTTAQLASHNHGVTDPTHNHGINNPAHSHGVNDPTHAHGVNDPTHAHGVDDYRTGALFGGGGAGGISSGGTTTFASNAATTGISINAASTGISIQNATTSISANAAATGISINSAGSGQAHNNMPPTMMVNFIIRVL